MPDWAVAVIVAIIASLPGLASWVKVVGDARRARAEAPGQQKQMLQGVADMASTTALRTLELATKELHLQLDETRAQGAEQAREIAELKKRLTETERELAQVKIELKQERQSNQRMAERIRQLEEERAGLIARIAELEGCK